MRDSVSLNMIPYLARGAKVTYYDPTGSKENFAKIKNCEFVDSINDNCMNADLVILHTEWDEFKSLEFKKIIKRNFQFIFEKFI